MSSLRPRAGNGALGGRRCLGVANAASRGQQRGGGYRRRPPWQAGAGHGSTVAPQESKIRPDHAAESPQQIGSMISPPPSSPFPCLWSLPPMSWFLALVWCGVDGKQEGGEREGMDGLCLHSLPACPSHGCSLPVAFLLQSFLLLQFMHAVRGFR
jgi:hypothetical protein